MAQTVVQDRSRSPGRTYTEQEWESVKAPFYHYYMEKNLSLKESAKRMLENYRFDATLRQWERRIAPEKWGFTKYASRDERLQAIQASGKTLLEVSHRGRRKSTASDGRPGLNEDRNMRRFARREVSRESRQRARSVSELSDPSDQDISGTSAAPSPAPSDLYTLDTQDDTIAFPPINHDASGDIWMSNTPSSRGSITDVPRIRVDHVDNAQDMAVPKINVLAPDEPDSHIAPEQISIARQSQVNAHYPQSHIDTVTFQPFQNASADPYNLVQSPTHDFNPHMSPHDQTSFTNNVPWQDPYVANPTPPTELFDGFSFTQMMGLDSHVMDEGNTILNAPIQSFETQETQVQEQMPTPLMPEDEDLEISDPTHADVHALLQEHYDKTMQMISMCIKSCRHATSTGAMMSNLHLLEKGVQAQSMNTITWPNCNTDHAHRYRV